MSRTLPLSEVKARFSEIIEEISTTQERITVTRNGRPVAVLLASDDIETLEETLAILSDPETMRSIEAGRAAVAAGDTVTREDLEGLRDRLRARTA
jgi:antitoxin YefM